MHARLSTRVLTMQIQCCIIQRQQTSLNYNACRTRVVTNTRRAEHIHPVLASLHWLPINYRIDYKVAILAYKIRSTGSPAYLLSFVSDYMPTRHLRSSTQLLLVKPPVKTEIGRRSFSQTTPAVWNSLPHAIRSAETIPISSTNALLSTGFHRLIT